ncbi:MAG: threonine synthase [Deltaproteobacteria bacterium]|nr:threonine synthase [Deltaproteobacteria bacterium]
MLFISTRGNTRPYSFRQTVMAGLAPDGGLFMPQTLPDVRGRLEEWKDLSFQDLCLEIISLFTEDEIPREELKGLIDKSYRVFDDPSIIPVKRVGDLFIAEQFHGPTLAFKDLALQFLGNLFEYLLADSQDRLTILGATSGDTGSAAIHALRGKKGIEVFILHPKGRVTPIQELQMTTVVDPNIHNLALLGSFDEAQAIVKGLFNKAGFRDKFRLGAVNSINWVRVMVQMVFFFHAYFRLVKQPAEAMPGGKKLNLGNPVRFAVPTGNFGHILAGHLARGMGLPVAKLVLATNANDNLHRFLSTGVYAHLNTQHTISPSMDIQVASNFERYLYELAGRDSQTLKNWLNDFESKGRLVLPDDRLTAMREEFSSASVDDGAILETIKSTYEQTGYLLDPHTAVGVRAALTTAEGGSGPQVPTVCMATAHPAKFGEAITQAIGKEPPLPPALAKLADMETRKTELPATLEAVEKQMRQTLESTV